MEFARVALMPFVLPRGIAARRLFDCRNAGLTSFLLRTIRCDIMTDMTSRRKTLKRDWFDNQPGAWVMVMLPALAIGDVGRVLLRAVQRRALVQSTLFTPLSAADAHLCRSAHRHRLAIPDYAYRHTALGSLIYSAGCAVDAVLVAEEGALAVGQCRVGDCRVGHGHGDRVVWQHC